MLWSFVKPAEVSFQDVNINNFPGGCKHVPVQAGSAAVEGVETSVYSTWA
jgi:hypothetical protein